MDLDKDVFTTFEAADICNANITSIKNWIDQGELSAFKTPGGHYRIEKEILDRFLERHDMPNPFAERRQKRVLVVHPDPGIVEELEDEIGDEPKYEATDDAVDALLKIGQWKPDVAVVDSRVEELDVAGLCRRIGEHADLGVVDVVSIIGDDDSDSEFREAGAAVAIDRDRGFDGVVQAVRDVIG